MLDAYLMEWGGMLLRWLHVITAIAWIGSSFFFIHLDASLRPAADIPAGRGRQFAPGRSMAAASTRCGNTWSRRRGMPEELTWHKWQSLLDLDLGLLPAGLGLLRRSRSST